MTQEQEPFLLHEKDDSGPAHKSPVGCVRECSPRWINWKFQILAHAVLITVYTVLAFAAIRAHSRDPMAPKRKIRTKFMVKSPFLTMANKMRSMT